MVDSPRKRYSRSPSPHEVLRSGSRPRSRSRSWSRPKDPRGRSRSQGRREQVNPGNTLYVSGLSTRVSERELDEHFSKEGKVSSCFLVVEPRTHLSRGFAFITMATMDDADRCMKFLDQSVLDGRCITVEKSRRKRARTPTPGRYLGSNYTLDHVKGGYGRNRGRRDDYGYRRRSPRRSSHQVGRNCDYSPRRPYQGGGGRRDFSSRQSPQYKIDGYSPRGSPPYKSGGYFPKRSSPPPYEDAGYSPSQSSPPPFEGGGYPLRRSPPPYEGGGGYSRRRSSPTPPYKGRGYSPRRLPPHYEGGGYSLRRSPPYEGDDGRDYSPRGSSYNGVHNYSPRQMNGKDRDYFPRPNDEGHFYSPRLEIDGYSPRLTNGGTRPSNGGGRGYSPRPSNGGRSIRNRSKSPPYSPYGR